MQFLQDNLGSVLLGFVIFLILFIVLGVVLGNTIVLRILMTFGAHVLSGRPVKDFRALRKRNKDCVGWISIPDTCYAPIMADLDGKYKKKDALGRDVTYGELMLADDKQAQNLKSIGKPSDNKIHDLAIIKGSSASRIATPRGAQFTWLRKYVNTDLKKYSPDVLIVEEGKERVFDVAFAVELGIEDNQRIVFTDRESFLRSMQNLAYVRTGRKLDNDVVILSANNPIDTMLVFLVERQAK